MAKVRYSPDGVYRVDLYASGDVPLRAGEDPARRRYTRRFDARRDSAEAYARGWIESPEAGFRHVALQEMHLGHWHEVGRWRATEEIRKGRFIAERAARTRWRRSRRGTTGQCRRPDGRYRRC
jgi:hypothetical protein